MEGEAQIMLRTMDLARPLDIKTVTTFFMGYSALAFRSQHVYRLLIPFYPLLSAKLVSSPRNETVKIMRLNSIKTAMAFLVMAVVGFL